MRPSILIVDDDEVIQETLLDVLKKRGYDIFLAGSGKEALETIKKNIIDLVLLDMRLPDVDGLDVLKKVKELDSEILVIMMTAYSDIQTAVAAMKSGAYDSPTFDLTQASSWNPAFITSHGGTLASAEAALLQAAFDGKAYLNIHTSYKPGGEIRGFLTLAQPVPEPSTLLLLGSGLIGLAGYGRKKLFKK